MLKLHLCCSINVAPVNWTVIILTKFIVPAFTAHQEMSHIGHYLCANCDRDGQCTFTLCKLLFMSKLSPNYWWICETYVCVAIIVQIWKNIKSKCFEPSQKPRYRSTVALDILQRVSFASWSHSVKETLPCPTSPGPRQDYLGCEECLGPAELVRVGRAPFVFRGSWKSLLVIRWLAATDSQIPVKVVINYYSWQICSTMVQTTRWMYSFKN